MERTNIGDFILTYMTELSQVLDPNILRHYGEIVELIEEQEVVKSEHNLRLLVLEHLWKLWDFPKDLDQAVQALEGSNTPLHRNLVEAWHQLPHKLVEAHWGLVKQAAATFHIESKVENEQEFLELTGVAQEVLFQSAKKYMRNPKGDFKSFVWPILRRKIKEEQGRKHPVPFKIRRKLGILGDLREEYRLRNDALTDELILSTLKVSQSEFEELLKVEAVWGNGLEFESDVVIEDIEEPDSSPDSLQILLNIESEEALSEAMTDLSDLEKILIRNLYFQDMSIREAAESMEMSLSVFRKNHKRALKKLKQGVDR